MSTIPVYATLEADPAVAALLGTRVYEFGQAPKDPLRPYLVWQTITGLPANTLGCPPEFDTTMVQLDIYADTARSARDTFTVVRDVIETKMYVTSIDGESRDPPTNYYRITFSVDWFVNR